MMTISTTDFPHAHGDPEERHDRDNGRSDGEELLKGTGIIPHHLHTARNRKGRTAEAVAHSARTTPDAAPP